MSRNRIDRQRAQDAQIARENNRWSNRAHRGIEDHGDDEVEHINFAADNLHFVKCRNCGNGGHERRNHGDCPENPRNIARQHQEQMVVENLTSVNETPIVICSHCDQSGHERRTHRDCLQNPCNLARQVNIYRECM